MYEERKREELRTCQNWVLQRQKLREAPCKRFIKEGLHETS